MDIYDNNVNKRISSGNLPAQRLFPASIESGREIDFASKAESMMNLFEDLPELFSILFFGFSKKVVELEQIDCSDEYYLQEVNSYINARCSEDHLKSNGSLEKAMYLVPVVTPLDKTLWYGAYIYQMEKLIGYADRHDMFGDTAFMAKCQDFTNAISRSVDNRNNASHGGTFISIEQCTDDKKTVLNNLEVVRLSSIGLIQRLLYLLKNA